MQTDVKLQPDFQYPWIWAGLIIIAFGVILFLIFHKKKVKEPPVPVVVPPTRDVYAIQMEYIMKLDQLAREYQQKSIPNRQMYFQISEIVRNFVFEMTGVSVQNYSLSEIAQLGLPMLTQLIEECYTPEFDQCEEKKDAMQTLYRTKEVIGTWNLDIH